MGILSPRTEQAIATSLSGAIMCAIGGLGVYGGGLGLLNHFNDLKSMDNLLFYYGLFVLSMELTVPGLFKLFHIPATLLRGIPPILVFMLIISGVIVGGVKLRDHYIPKPDLIKGSPGSGTMRVVSKSCGRCGRPVPVTSTVGMSCPSCSVRWGKESGNAGDAVAGIFIILLVLGIPLGYLWRMCRILCGDFDEIAVPTQARGPNVPNTLRRDEQELQRQLQDALRRGK